MIEAFLLALYLLILSPILFWLGIRDPLIIFVILTVLTLPGIYAMLKGAPFVPTSRKRTSRMIELAKINSKSIVYDFGSGDGRFVFGAAASGAKKAIGYELSLPIYIYSKIKSYFIPNSEIRFKDFFFDVEQFKDADIVFCFLMPKTMIKFQNQIWPHLKPGVKLVSNVFRMPDLEPIHQEEGIKIYQKPV